MNTKPVTRIAVLFLAILVTSPGYAATILVPAEHPTIQAGIRAASAGDLVLVAPGSYVETIDLLGKAITVRGAGGAGLTVIDGDRAGSVVTFAEGETGGTVLEGFTVTNGRADAGGGIYCFMASPTIRHCTIRGNDSVGSCEACGGGGIYCEEASPSILGCTISGNTSVVSGGGLSIRRSSNPLIVNSFVEDNESLGYQGGGIWCRYDASPRILHCTITGNRSQRPGGGVACESDSFPEITNSILWGNTGVEISGCPCDEISYSDIRDGVEPCGNSEGLIDADPLFVDVGDPHLSVNSPCIDSGVDVGVRGDLDGDPRPMGIGFDMGADEFPGECPDLDDDGYTDARCGGEDCDDLDPATNPGAHERCDGVDNDCDGRRDEGFRDRDRDGFAFCVDCDDTDPETNPRAAEVCDGKDNDCDALIDEEPECVVLEVPEGYPTIQDALDAAEERNTIRVAPGTYRENLTFRGRDVTVRSEAGPDTTVIDGGQDGSVVTFEGGESARAVLEGFTLRNGKGTFLTDSTLGFRYYAGGGIYCREAAPTITRCRIEDNVAYLGGGLYLRDADPTITNSVIARNRAAGLVHGGGGLYLEDASPAMTNCTIRGNGAIYYGGGIFCWLGSPTLTSCILWEDESIFDPSIHVRSGAPVITYSDVMGGWPGEGNLEADPLFTGPRDVHLTPGSPCIDAGVYSGLREDLDGEPRPWGEEFDMGADEYAPQSCSVLAASGNQFLGTYLIPVLALVLLRVATRSSRRREDK